ncbi:cystatin-2-like isoform X1 [Dermacentor variabilis]|uniref:cystatin-2-like isoform X1 n=1 Tax=Dermacentor variabilis TaxID=34621 RepID=UPI003F5AE845
MGKYEHGRGAPQFPTFLLLLLLTFEATRCVGFADRSLPGGWVEQDPRDPTFLIAARFAERKAAAKGGHRYRVLRVTSAWTQVVNGINYRMFYTRGLKCGPGQSWKICNGNPVEPTENCMAIVYAPFHSSRRQLVAHSCYQWDGVGSVPVDAQTLAPPDYGK